MEGGTGEFLWAVVVEGPSAINMASPLVCDVEGGECLAMPAAFLAAGITVDQFVAAAFLCVSFCRFLSLIPSRIYPSCFRGPHPTFEPFLF
eukprot:SAG22_NODE_242_length_14104_cov_13.581935_10_plen_91_part_00